MLTRFALVVALMLAVPTSGSAQSTGTAEFGFRLSSIQGDPARLQRFRDLGEGVAVDRVKVDRAGERSFLSLWTDHTGRRDQRYGLEYLHGGRVKLSAVWDQIPQFFSRDTRTLFQGEGPGVFTLNDAIQESIQANLASQAGLASGASPFEIRSRRHVLSLASTYSATRDLDLIFRLRSTDRSGSVPYSVTFGQANVVELPAPLDSRTTDVTAGAEWVNRRASLRVAYDGSMFSSEVRELIWDNPRRLTDTASEPGRGQAALAPNNSLHAVTTAGSLKLPARSHLTGSVTVGSWRQDDALLPFTINSALVSPALPRPTANALARTLAMNYTATSRPWRMLWLNGRYRFYDFDNRTPHFEITQRVRTDSAIVPGSAPEALSSTRHQLDLDAAFTPVRFTSLRLGYGREQVDRTHRIFGETDEQVFRASADTTIFQIVTLRSSYERARRTGSRFDEQALIAVNEQPAMRHFDIADRERDRVTALVQVVVRPSFSVSTSVARGTDDYANSGFGLRDNSNLSYTVSLDWVPEDRLSAGLSFADERYDSLQRSRNATPGAQFVDPTRDWSTDARDRTRTWTANLDVLRLVPAMDIRLAYDQSRSRATYVYGFPAGSTLPAPVQLSPVLNRLQRGTADLRYHLNARFAVGVLYLFDAYQVQDFSMGPETVTGVDIASNLFLGYVYRPYRAHVTSLRFMYAF